MSSEVKMNKNIVALFMALCLNREDLLVIEANIYIFCQRYLKVYKYITLFMHAALISEEAAGKPIHKSFSFFILKFNRLYAVFV